MKVKKSIVFLGLILPVLAINSCSKVKIKLNQTGDKKLTEIENSKVTINKELSPKENYKALKRYNHEEQGFIFDFPSDKEAFTDKMRTETLVMPFLKRFLQGDDEFINHPLFNKMCYFFSIHAEKIGDPKDIKLAQELLEKNPQDEVALIYLFNVKRKMFTDEQWDKKLSPFAKKAKTAGHKIIILRTLMRLHNQKKYGKDLEKTAYNIAVNEQLSPQESSCLLDYKLYAYNKQKDIATFNPANKWLKNIMLGKLYVTKAWDARGRGYSNTVTEDGWNGFKENLTLAEKYILEADKEWCSPTVAYYMIQVSRGKYNTKECFKWFNKGLKTQADSKLYDTFSFYIRPRWCGNNAMLTELAEKMLNHEYVFTRKYYSYRLNEFIPLAKQAMTPMLYAAITAKDKYWQRPYRLLASEKLHRAFTEWGVEFQETQEVREACYYYYIGNYEKANEIINKIGKDKFADMQYRQIDKTNWLPCIAKIEEDIPYRLGDFGIKMQKVDDLLYAKKTAESLVFLQDIYDDLNEDKDKRLYALKRYIFHSTSGTWEDYYYGHTEIVMAFHDGQVDLIDKMIELGYDINSLDNCGSGISTLSYAAQRCDAELVEFLLEKGADPNISNHNGQVPLIAALRYHDKNPIGSIKLLIDAGANVNSQQKPNRITALHRAIRKKNNTEVIQLLIDAKASVDQISGNKYQYTPLMWSVMKKHFENAKLLLKAGADPTIKSKQNKTPIFEALKNDSKGKLFGLILKNSEGIEVLYKKNPKMAMYLALYDKSGKSLKKLLKQGFDPNYRNTKFYDMTILMYAAQYSGIKNVKILVEAGADINATCSLKNPRWTVWEYAEYPNHSEKKEVMNYLELLGAIKKVPKKKTVTK